MFSCLSLLRPVTCIYVAAGWYQSSLIKTYSAENASKQSAEMRPPVSTVRVMAQAS